ncbi:MAG: hypothetical protein LBU76_05155 [Azoarcus sp.]|jgi:hypothetical protein|nr:hypothetical protein [Azoarcus sp.]
MADEGKIPMSKFLMRLAILMSVFYSSVCISQQGFYGFSVSLYNMCPHTVQITSSHYRPKGDEILSIEKLLTPNESTIIFLGIDGSPKIKRALPNDYKLEISTNGKTLSLDKDRFLEILKKSGYSEEKCGFFCRTGTFLGTIKAPSLCP